MVRGAVRVRGVPACWPGEREQTCAALALSLGPSGSVAHVCRTALADASQLSPASQPNRCKPRQPCPAPPYPAAPPRPRLPALPAALVAVPPPPCRAHAHSPPASSPAPLPLPLLLSPPSALPVHCPCPPRPPHPPRCATPLCRCCSSDARCVPPAPLQLPSP